MVFDLCNSTVLSKDESGDDYYVDFELLPRKCGDTKFVFKGMYFGNGGKRGRKCAVKVNRECFVKYPEHWLSQINISRTAAKIATVFNKCILREQGRRVRFRIPFAALMDTVCKSYSVMNLFAACVGRDLKQVKPHRDEYVLVEDYIRGDFSRLNANNGWKSANVEYKELQAFAHFTWCYSGGDLVVGDLQGVRTAKRYLLTDPVIHSKSREFGDRDNGIDGIEQFFSEHVCNDLCKNWAKPIKCRDVNRLESLQEMDKCSNNSNNIYKAQMTECLKTYPINTERETNFSPDLTQGSFPVWTTKDLPKAVPVLESGFPRGLGIPGHGCTTAVPILTFCIAH